MLTKIRVFVTSILLELAVRLTSLDLLISFHKGICPFHPAQNPVEYKPPLTPQKDYQTVLQELAQQGKPIPKELCCPDCGDRKILNLPLSSTAPSVDMPSNPPTTSQPTPSTSVDTRGAPTRRRWKSSSGTIT